MKQDMDVRCVDGSIVQAPVLDVADVVELEQHIAQNGTSLLELMTRAGTALARAVETHAKDAAKIVILTGSGNNGGDGWVAAQALANAGRNVTLTCRAVPEELTAQPARTAALAAKEAGGFTIAVAPTEVELQSLLDDADVIVDAILGTGFAHDQVREPYATWIRSVDAAHGKGSFVIAADCPSGLNAQTGAAACDCIIADETVTMIVPKSGLMKPAAQPYVGSLLLAPLVPEEERLNGMF